MKTLEILLRLIDKLLVAIKFRKAQHERNELEESPSVWFANHFGGVSDTKGKTDKANPSDNA